MDYGNSSKVSSEALFKAIGLGTETLRKCERLSARTAQLRVAPSAQAAPTHVGTPAAPKPSPLPEFKPNPSIPIGPSNVWR